MANMRDTEGEQIPKSEGYDLFNLTLFYDGMMSMIAPAFVTDSGEYTAHVGVLEVSLRNVFDEFLANKNNLINRPDEHLDVANLLREYAEKFEAFATLVSSTAPSPPPTVEDVQVAIVALTMAFRESTKAKIH